MPPRQSKSSAPATDSSDDEKDSSDDEDWKEAAGRGASAARRAKKPLFSKDKIYAAVCGERSVRSKLAAPFTAEVVQDWQDWQLALLHRPRFDQPAGQTCTQGC